MNTRTIIEQYFEHLKTKSGWEASFADDMVFTSFTSPPKEVRGKAAYLRALAFPARDYLDPRHRGRVDRWRHGVAAILRRERSGPARTGQP